MKYTVKNCPGLDGGLKTLCTQSLNDKFVNAYCADCPDCLIKRVIEKCKTKIDFFKSIDIGSTHMINFEGYSQIAFFAQEILDMFEIEEVRG